MKNLITALLVTLIALAANSRLSAAETTVSDEMRTLIQKVQTKLKDGRRTEAELKDELAAFDTILAKHKGEKTDEVAQVLMMKAMLYSQVLNDEKKGDELLAELQKEFPDSKAAAMLKKQEEAKKARQGLVEGAAFPAFDVKDTNGKSLSVAGLKGKVVLIDFWATWCGPCVKELPNVIAAYDKHHAAGFEIIGVSLDKDKSKLDAFVNENKMTWPQFFDGKGWENELAQKYGINSIPATYLLDREGKIIGIGLRGEQLEQAVAAALAKK